VQLAAAFLPTQLAESHVNILDNWMFVSKHAKKTLHSKLRRRKAAASCQAARTPNESLR